ncbi:hypothetical protein SAMN06295926_10823 [Lysinibacillus sp. AC-3]|nr:hypothetical protein SAMN06295926_10823 [Lysinibacillus sp. AC-3]
MKKLNLSVLCDQLYERTVSKIAPNILNRQFTADNPNQKWGLILLLCLIAKSLYIRLAHVEHILLYQ